MPVPATIWCAAPLRGAVKHRSQKSAVSDELLLAQVVAGRQEALTELFHRYAARLATYLSVLGKFARVDVDEAVQLTFISVWDNAYSFRGDSSVRTWIVGIARNHLRTQLRDLQDDGWESSIDVGRDLPDNESAEAHPEETVLTQMELDEVMARIRKLPLSHREVITLVCVLGFSMKETAAIMGIPEGTVKSRLLYARASATRRSRHRQIEEEESRR